MTTDYRQPRNISKSFAAILQELESFQPDVVNSKIMGEAISEVGSDLTVRDATDRLVRAGWLLPLRTRDAWEFVGAEYGGRDWSTDPWMELRALLKNDPQAPVAVSFYSAVWISAHAMHPPVYSTFAYRPGWRPPKSLSGMPHTSYDWKLPCKTRDKLPTWQEATIVVAVAARPMRCGGWDESDTWLAETFEAASIEDIMFEAEGRPTAALARLGYLAEWSGQYPLANEVQALLPHKLPVTYLGQRKHRGTWRKKWGVYDSLLPINSILPYRK